jgi:hypothetical protein
MTPLMPPFIQSEQNKLVGTSTCASSQNVEASFVDVYQQIPYLHMFLVVLALLALKGQPTSKNCDC